MNMNGIRNKNKLPLQKTSYQNTDRVQYTPVDSKFLTGMETALNKVGNKSKPCK